MWLAQQLSSVALVGNPRFTPTPGAVRCRELCDHVGVAQLAVLAAVCWAAKLPYTAAVCVAVALRIGVMCTIIHSLPSIKSPPHFENCRFRVLQCVSLISVCAAIYSTLPPAVQKKTGHEGYKHNLVTMESSMASCIASTYGYSVAGGIPGGLLGEYVMSSVGKKMVVELLSLVAGTAVDGWLQALVRACVSFTLFTVMGAYMEWVVVLGYAFAQQEEGGYHVAIAAVNAVGAQKQRNLATDQASVSPHNSECISSLPSAVDAIDQTQTRRRVRQSETFRSPSPAAGVRLRR